MCGDLSCVMLFFSLEDMVIDEYCFMEHSDEMLIFASLLKNE